MEYDFISDIINLRKESTKDQHPDMQKLEEHLKKIKQEFLQTSSFSELPSIIFEQRPDGFWESGYVIASKFFKKPISEFNFKSSELNYSILHFFETNGVCIYRISSESCFESTYLFYYKNAFYSLSVNLDELTQEYIVISLTVFYLLEEGIPYEDFDQFRKKSPPPKAKISIIKNGRGGLYVSKINLPCDQIFDINYYNEDFVEFEQNIISQLSEKKAGLFLLHGEPGTGKSSAIRHLIQKVNRNFIFVPPQLIGELSSPEFADIITDTQKGSVIILEDAEKALMKRESEDGFSNSILVSSILNLTDGLFADLGQLAIIATYNCDRNLIDKALLRKGRLKAEYRFSKLNKKRSQELINKLGKNYTVSEDMTLADIFNLEDQYTNTEETSKEKSIGFANRPGF